MLVINCTKTIKSSIKKLIKVTLTGFDDIFNNLIDKFTFKTSRNPTKWIKTIGAHAIFKHIFCVLFEANSTHTCVRIKLKIIQQIHVCDLRR